jgi:hypothetical protein
MAHPVSVTATRMAKTVRQQVPGFCFSIPINHEPSAVAKAMADKSTISLPAMLRTALQAGHSSGYHPMMGLLALRRRSTSFFTITSAVSRSVIVMMSW